MAAAAPVQKTSSAASIASPMSVILPDTGIASSASVHVPARSAMRAPQLTTERRKPLPKAVYSVMNPRKLRDLLIGYHVRVHCELQTWLLLLGCKPDCAFAKQSLPHSLSLPPDLSGIPLFHSFLPVSGFPPLNPPLLTFLFFFRLFCLVSDPQTCHQSCRPMATKRR